MTPTRAFYLDAGAEPIFAVFDEPGEAAGGRVTAVLLSPPFGWQDVSSYRARRDWARELATIGHPTLRIDLPGSGDSGGGPNDPGRFDAWVAALIAAASWLGDASGCPRLAAVGIGLSGIALYQAILDGAAIDDLVLWGVGARGRPLVREQRAFAALEQTRPPAAEAPVVPEGALMTAGFLLSAETLRQLERFDMTSSAPPKRLRRALLLGRDGIAADERLRRVLIDAGVEVSTHGGDGFADMMMSEPQFARLANETLTDIAAWVRRGDELTGRVGSERRESSSATPASVVTRSEAEMGEPGGGRVRETPLTFESAGVNLRGVLTEPIGRPRDLCLVLLNPGAVRRTGVNRMWVELARRWAARGVPTLRIDLEGIGDADGKSGTFVDFREFYVPTYIDHVRTALDALAQRGLPARFVVMGLCSGSYWSFQTALADERVVAAFMLNASWLISDPALPAARDARRFRRSAVTGDAWKRVLAGETSPRRLLVASRALTRSVSAQIRASITLRDRDRSGFEDRLAHALDRLRDRDQHGVLLFSAEEPLYEELERTGFLARLDRWPNLRLLSDQRLRSGAVRQHTLRPLWLQRHVHALLDAELEYELAMIERQDRERD